MTKQELYEKTTDICSRLIQIKSDSGQEGAVGAEMARIFRELGYDEVATDDYGNVIGRIHGSRPGARVLLDGHLDTVPVDDPTRWEHDPYGGLVLDDRVYGRGASDMKGAVAAMICAACDHRRSVRTQPEGRPARQSGNRSRDGRPQRTFRKS